MKNSRYTRLFIYQQIRMTIKKVNAEKIQETYKSRRFIRRFKKGLLLIVLVHLIGILVNYLAFEYEFWDNDKNRGAVAVKNDLFNESYKVPEYLEQGWTNRESLWFYKISQGSNLIPYDFYMALEQADSETLFHSNESIRKYQYLIQKKTHSNPDALPVGFAKDIYKGKEYLGFACAACHTSQINYSDIKTGENKAIRIDGGPAQSDLESFMLDLSDALQDTLCDKSHDTTCDDAKQKKFVKRVLERNGFKKALLGGRSFVTEQDVLDDLKTVTRKLIIYNWINRSDTRYGYSRLDAFGRIYNRIIEHVIDDKTIGKVLSDFLPEKESEIEDTLKEIRGDSNDKLRLVDATLDRLNYKQKQEFLGRLFTSADAPVSYPYLWDIPFHDYLQWNGIVNNAGGGALGRNVGQVIGVFGTLDWKKNDSFSPSNFLINKKSVLDSVSFHSSINMRNIARVENQLKQLRSPVWPEEKLGSIDEKKSGRGKIIFKKYCQDCHGQIDRSDPQRRITAHFSSIDKVGTDAKMATNSITKTGYTGMIQGSYVDVPAGKLLLQEKAPVAIMVATTTENVLKTPDMDTNVFIRWSDWAYDMFFVIFENPVEDTLKKGDYTPDSTTNPFASLLSYKARPLNGIWATAPFLHNGSVPTLYDLLLPQKERPETFIVGSRSFESMKVGFKTEGYEGFIFDTTQEGNHNTGHEYAAGNTALPNGEKLKPLDDDQRYDLIEYLKTL